MAISNTSISNNNLASVALEQVDQNLAKSETAIEIKQGLEQAQTIASGFTTIFSLLQQSTETNSKSQSGEKQDEKLIDSFQGSLLGSLGVGGVTGDTLEKQLKSLTSDESIEKLQAAFLVNLQQSLFTAKSVSAETESKGEGAPVEDTQEQQSLTAIQALEKLSFGKDGLEANDGFDTVNVLNHVPVVSELYKNVSGHDISGISKLAGGYLYGGPTGLVFSALELTTQSLFDTSISGLITNFNYSQLFGTAQPQQEQQSEQSSFAVKPTEQLATEKESVNTIYWPNRYVRDSESSAK